MKRMSNPPVRDKIGGYDADILGDVKAAQPRTQSGANDIAIVGMRGHEVDPVFGQGEEAAG